MNKKVSVLILPLLMAACAVSARAHFHNAEMALMAKDYTTAVSEYDEVLKQQPDSVTARFGKAKALYGAKRWAEAKTLFEEFIAKTDNDQHEYRNERRDAAFYRDRCTQEMGGTVAQDPTKIPPPPMGE